MNKPGSDSPDKGPPSSQEDRHGGVPPATDSSLKLRDKVDQRAQTISLHDSLAEGASEGSFDTVDFDYSREGAEWVEQSSHGHEAPPRQEPGRTLDEVPPGEDPFLDRVLVNRYRMIRRIGTGGFGAVYAAEDTKIHKLVAVKVLARDLVGDASMVTRFRKEAEAASKVGHENIIDITDFDRSADGHYFLVMELLEGTDLGSVIRSGEPISLARVLGIMVQVCRGLHVAHDKGIIHRDLKPGNIFLTSRGSMVDFVKLLDFGITKFTELDDASSRLTRTGQIIGTPLYMSPEQAMGEEEIDRRADIYSLGVILYEMITGQPPFTAVNYLGIIAQHASDPPRPPSEVRPDLELPPEVEEIILRALSKKPADRFSTMAEMEAVLLDVLADVDPAVAVGYNPNGRPPSILTTATGLSQRRLSSGRSMPLWLIFIVAALVGVVGALVASYTRKGDGPGGVGGAIVDAGAPSLPDRGPPATPDAARPLDRGAASAKQADQRSATVLLAVTSEPAGARVIHPDGRILGVTPLEVAWPRGAGEVILSLKLRGYRTARQKVIPDGDKGVQVTLKKRYSGGLPDDPKGWGEK